MFRLNSCLLLFAILSLTSTLGSSATPAKAVKGNPLRSNSMYSSRLLSINTINRLLNNSSDISPHKTNTSPSLLFQNWSKSLVIEFKLSKNIIYVHGAWDMGESPISKVTEPTSVATMSNSFYGFAFLCSFYFCTYPISGQARECRLDQKSDLLQLRNLFLLKSQSVYCKTSLGFPRPLTIASWNTSMSDCCTWGGIRCSPDTGNVMSINLGCNPLRSSSMYSSKLLSNNSFDISPHKATASPSLLFQNWSKQKVLIFDGLDLFSVDLPLFTNLPSSLQVLNFHSCQLRDYFPEEVFLLPNLKRLDLSLNLDLYGHLPRSNWNSPLQILDLSSTSFFGQLPAAIGNLRSLQVLWLREGNFTGSLPASLGNKSTGQIPSTFSNLQSLILFFLSSNNILGPVPDMFTNMTKLLYLDFSNNRFNASISMSLLSVPSMIDLDLSNNLLSGHINRVQPSSLRSIKLFGYQPEGSIPPSLTELLNVTTLLLSPKRFTGLFDLKMLSQMNKMETLDLSHNMMTLSNIDHDFEVTLPSLSSLSLSRCNLTKFPTFVRTARNLITLDLSRNRIQGRIPAWMWEVGSESLAYLDLSHYLLTSLEQVPWVNFLFLDLHSNNIMGLIPPQLPNSITFFIILSNEFVGHIPTSICQAENLKILDLSNNSLNSTIPNCLGKFSRILEVLDLQGNQISGSISNSTFQENNNLRSIHLNRNQLEGQLPRSLVNCQRLEVLDLGKNMFSDTFPSWLDTMPNLQVLVLRSNQFHGTITHSGAESPFPHLRILYISFNKFSGLLPERYFESMVAVMLENKNEQKLQYLGEGIYYQDSVMVAIKVSEMQLGKILSIFSSLDFCSNSFEGPILNAIGHLISLEGLNHLIGAIPSSLGKLSELEWSYMFSDKSARRIPSELTQPTYRVILNLSDNHLVGHIPHGNRFNTYPPDVRSGNRGLCGFPLSKSCRIFQNPTMMPQQIHNKDSLLSENVVEFLGVGCLYGVVIGLIIEGLWHHATERGFEFFTWSFTPTRSTIKCYFRSTKQNPMNRGPFVAFAVVVIIVQIFDPAASTLILQNQCSTPIAICNIDASGPIYVKQRDIALMELSGSLVFWAHKETSDTICTMENPAATMVEIDVSSSSQSYKVSVEDGFNLGIKIIALGGIGCPIVACTAKLTDCPDVLKVRSPNNVVIACNPPNCSKSKELCSLYASLMGNSLCQKPGLSYEPSTIAASCALSIDLVISFTCG